MIPYSQVNTKIIIVPPYWLRCLAPKREPTSSSLCWVLTKAGWPGRYINVWHCGGLSMVLLQLKDPLELFIKRKEFLPGSRFLSRRDMTQAVESDVKLQSILPSFLRIYIRELGMKVLKRRDGGLPPPPPPPSGKLLMITN